MKAPARTRTLLLPYMHLVDGELASTGRAKRHKARRFAWALEQLRKGHAVGRHAWVCDTFPKRLFLHLEKSQTAEVLVLEREGQTRICATFTWGDIVARDWYVLTQLELIR